MAHNNKNTEIFFGYVGAAILAASILLGACAAQVETVAPGTSPGGQTPTEPGTTPPPPSNTPPPPNDPGTPPPPGNPGTPGTPGAGARTVRVTWQPAGVSDIAGYYVAYGIVPGQPTEFVWAGNTTHLDIRVPAGQTYYFSVKVVDNNGNESPLSDEAAVSVP